jgi:hypothetical protein
MQVKDINDRLMFCRFVRGKTGNSMPRIERKSRHHYRMETATLLPAMEGVRHRIRFWKR